MNEELFNINNFNIIQDAENYYFFRALNNADNADIESGIVMSEDGKIERIRTDRERKEDVVKYNENSNLSLGEIFDHIKTRHSKETNCISLTSNANVAINYGRGIYNDKYIMVKIPKKEFGKDVVFAGKYMLQELYLRIQQALENLPEDKKNEILNIFNDIEQIEESKDLKEIITKRYTAKIGEVDPNKVKMRDGIIYAPPKPRICSYQALSKEQLLEANKVYAKLAILENENILGKVIPYAQNSKFREAIGNAFSSVELIHYKDIKQENIIEVSKEIVDLFALIQQFDSVDKNKIGELKQAILIAMQSGKPIPKISEIEEKVRDNITIEEMYELTEGKVEYGKANSIVKNMFYLSKSRQNAIVLSNVLKEIVEENSSFQDVIENIRKNGFRIEPEIIIRQSGKGVKLSEAVNLNLQKEEKQLVDEIKELSFEELDLVLKNGGLYNARNIITRAFGNVRENEKIDKSRYYAEAIISKYNWNDIGILEFKTAERNELIKRLQERDCVEIYNRLKEKGIEESKISTVILNIAMREGFYEQYKNGNLEELLNTRQDVLFDNINIEIVERFLGYYDVENTNIKLKGYQQRAYNNINKILEDEKFAQVILPTGAGKSFVALAQMNKYAKEHQNEKILYLAPQEEILNQFKNYIVKYVHGKQGTVGKTVDEIIAEVFPNITFETYSGLLAKRGEEVIKEQYGMIVLDELHRTGAKEWEGQIDKLLENQTEDVKVLGITATPTRDVDGRDMANEVAKKLGYADEEIKQRKHIASNMTLENAIRMEYVVNPKLVYCKYDLISSGKMDELKLMIDDIEDEIKKAEELEKYNKLREKLNKEIDEEIGEEARKRLEEEARKNLDTGIGKEEILRQNIKKGGKYIVFIPVTDQGDIEDEEGNRIGTKTGEDKIKAYQDYLNEVFKGTDIELSLHSLLGSYSKEKNKEEIEVFEADNSEKTKFMVVMNKANEGLHIDGVDGIIWFRALDENSRILYLQQLGRAIFALDEDNPLSDDKRPVIIDLANNSLTVKMGKEFKNSKTVDDLEALIIVLEWSNEHDEILPDGNSTNKQEQQYYAVLRKIQEKYSKYLDGFDNFEDLKEEDKNEIEEIIELATQIDLWNIDFPPIIRKNGSKEEVNPFEITGVLKDFVDFEEEVEVNFFKNIAYQNILKIEKWCELNYGEKPIWERKLPSSCSKNEEEKKLGLALRHIRVRTNKYAEKELEQIDNEEDRKIVEIVRRLDREYGLSIPLKNALEIENWCKVNYGDKEIWNKEMPKRTVKDKEEKRLGEFLSALRKKIRPYEGKDLNEIEDINDKKIVEIIRKLDEEYGLSISLKNALEIENWCKVNYGDKQIEERKLPSSTSKNNEEKRLGRALEKIRKKIKPYDEKSLDEVENIENRKILEIVRRLDKEYKCDVLLKNILRVENWCKVNYGDKEIWNRKLPSSKSREKEEARMGELLIKIRKKISPYEGKDLNKIEDINDKKIVEIVRRLDEEYGLDSYLKNALEIENWCKVNYEDKQLDERKLPTSTSKDNNEKRLGVALSNIRKKIKEYEEINIEEIENEKDRKIVEIVRRLDEKYNSRKSKNKALQQAQQERDNAKETNDEVRLLEKEVEEELKKRGKLHEE